jgi:Ca2+:H+ antiporter
MSVAHHAEMLAEKFGEPYGTLILTMSAVIVEIVIIVIMMSHSQSPELARDTIYAAVMLDVNGLLGIAAIIGGIKYGEQPYNVDSSNSYLSMLLVAIGIAMVLPEFVDPIHHNKFMIFNVIVFVFLYIIFTRIQLTSHKYFFEYGNKEEIVCDEAGVCEPKHEINAWYHAFNLVVSIVVIGVLAEILSVFMGNTLETFGLPLAIGAVGVALISAAPELITAVRAAVDNRMQTVINIALVASLATVLLKIPAVIVAAYYMGMELNLSLTPVQTLMVALTLLVSMVNFNDGETNVLEGFLHFILFIVFGFLLFV